MISAKDVFNFWFHEISSEMHFKKSEKFDNEIRNRFLATYEDIVASNTSDWRKTPQGRLAEIIVLDQFSRSMFRDVAKSFSADGLALNLAQAAVAVGDDQKLPLEQRVFFYLPYMHSESKVVHEEAVKLFSQAGMERTLKFEMMHKRIIDRFGRYPHRNKILNRISTAEELEFLNEKNSSF